MKTLASGVIGSIERALPTHFCHLKGTTGLAVAPSLGELSVLHGSLPLFSLFIVFSLMPSVL